MKILKELMRKLKRRFRRTKVKIKEKFQHNKPDVFYFSYGSNMSSFRLADRIKTFRRIGTYRLHGWGLRFNAGKKTAFANIVKADDEFVDGVIYLIPYKAIRRLDGYEALYERMQIDDDKYEFPIEFYVSDIFTDAPSTMEYLHHIKTGIMENSLEFPKAYLLHREKSMMAYLV